jgi:hypothetical protein
MITEEFVMPGCVANIIPATPVSKVYGSEVAIAVAVPAAIYTPYCATIAFCAAFDGGKMFTGHGAAEAARTVLLDDV